MMTSQDINDVITQGIDDVTGKDNEPVKVAHHRLKSLVASGAVVQQICGLGPEYANSLAKTTHVFNDVLLLIVFNSPTFGAIPFTEALYRPSFEHILYCVQQDPPRHLIERYGLQYVLYPKETNRNPWHITNGAFNYECVKQSVEWTNRQKNSDLAGLLFLCDDAMLHFWHMRHFPRDRVWFRTKSPGGVFDLLSEKECHGDVCDIVPTWPWWFRFRDEISRSMAALRDSSDPVAKTCYANLVQVMQGKNRTIGHSLVDAFYLPFDIAQRFALLAPIFTRTKLWMEIAVPNMVFCLTHGKEIWEIPGYYDWSHWQKELSVAPDEPWLYYSDHTHLTHVHPVKLGLIHSSPKHKSFFCKELLPHFMKSANSN